MSSNPPCPAKPVRSPLCDFWLCENCRHDLREDFQLQVNALLGNTQNESAPETGALPNFNRSEPQAATLVGLTSRSLLELVIGIARGFIASGISRTRSTCRSPFSRLAPLTLT